jgi:alkylation response protein AidB-like acyl-CoA dehydrogenase
MHDLLPAELRQLKQLAEEVSTSAIAPLSADVDREARWPDHAFRALADAGLLGLQVPRKVGGLGRSLGPRRRKRDHRPGLPLLGAVLRDALRRHRGHRREGDGR